MDPRDPLIHHSLCKSMRILLIVMTSNSWHSLLLKEKAPQEPEGLFPDHHDWLLREGLIPIIGWGAGVRSDEVRGHSDPVSQGTESEHTCVGDCSGTESVHV